MCLFFFITPCDHTHSDLMCYFLYLVSFVFPEVPISEHFMACAHRVFGSNCGQIISRKPYGHTGLLRADDKDSLDACHKVHFSRATYDQGLY